MPIVHGPFFSKEEWEQEKAQRKQQTPSYQASTPPAGPERLTAYDWKIRDRSARNERIFYVVFSLISLPIFCFVAWKYGRTILEYGAQFLHDHGF